MAITYGLPYMGSKNSIAKNLIKQLPRRENFYDLFCGGGAMAHRAAEFREVYNIEKTVLMSAKGNDKKAVEKLFIPRKNKLHLEEVEQLTLY